MSQESYRKRKRNEENEIELKSDKPSPLIPLLNEYLLPELSRIVAEYEKSSIDGVLVRTSPSLGSHEMYMACTNQYIVLAYVHQWKVEFRDRSTFDICKTIPIKVHDAVSRNDDEVILLDRENLTIRCFRGLHEVGTIPSCDGSTLAAYGNVVVASSFAGTVRVFEWTSKTRINTFETTTLCVYYMALHGNKLFIPNVFDVHVHDINNGSVVETLVLANEHCVPRGVAVTCDEVYVMDNETGVVHVWSRETGKETRKFTVGKSNSGLTLTPDGQLVTTDARSGVVRFFK